MPNISNSPFRSCTVISRSALLLSMLLFSGMALADKPEWAGTRDGADDKKQSYKPEKRNGKYEHENHERDGDYNSRHESRRYSSRDNDRRSRVDIRIGGYIDDEHRHETRQYYREYSRSGRCPPGLARKHNGCRPYGHSRRWAMGEYLPRDVVYHTVEPEIRIRLGNPPRGHEFVRVASDILLIAVGTGLVVDAIDDLGQ